MSHTCLLLHGHCDRLSGRSRIGTTTVAMPALITVSDCDRLSGRSRIGTGQIRDRVELVNCDRLSGRSRIGTRLEGRYDA